jgi:adenylyl cyclase-associated protein
MSGGSSKGSSGPDMGNVFAALNKGEGVTSGLKKVTNDMKTKNRTDKSSVVPASSAKESTSNANKNKEVASKPPKLALEGNKWAVEWQVNNKNIVISDTEAKHTVYIYKCKGCTIQIKGKVNAITVDDCSKSAVVFENCIASAEVVNCNSLELQVLGKVPSFAVDKTSGCQIYLSRDSIEAEIVTSKSSEMNVLIPGRTPDDDLVEMAIPEQFKTVVKNGRLHTESVAHV